MAAGCSGLERRILPQQNTNLTTAVPLHNNASLSTPTSPTPPPQPVTLAAFSDGGTQDSAVVQPATVGVVAVDSNMLTNENMEGITLEALLSLAFANNPAVKELAATTQIAAGYRTQVGLYANPLLGYQGQQLADAGTDQHLIFVQQQIITGGKLELNRAVLNEAVRAQLQELEAQKLRVTTDIKTAYYDCVRIQKQLRAIDQFSSLLKQGVSAAETRFNCMLGTPASATISLILASSDAVSCLRSSSSCFSCTWVCNKSILEPSPAVTRFSAALTPCFSSDEN